MDPGQPAHLGGASETIVQYDSCYCSHADADASRNAGGQDPNGIALLLLLYGP